MSTTDTTQLPAPPGTATPKDTALVQPIPNTENKPPQATAHRETAPADMTQLQSLQERAMPERSKTISHPGGNIRVTTPKPGSVVSAEGFVLRGEARTFENMVSYRLTDAHGETLVSGHVQAKGPMGTFSGFQTRITPGRGGTATLTVFENSAKDGSEINAVRIPIVIEAPARSTSPAPPR